MRSDTTATDNYSKMEETSTVALDVRGEVPLTLDANSGHGPVDPSIHTAEARAAAPTPPQHQSATARTLAFVSNAAATTKTSVRNGLRPLRWHEPAAESTPTRPCPYCAQAVSSNGPDATEVVCGTCSRAFCFIHGSAHEGKSCGAFELQKMTRDDAQPCPRCERPVEKTFGRREATCKACAAVFCWGCRLPFADPALVECGEAAPGGGFFCECPATPSIAYAPGTSRGAPAEEHSTVLGMVLIVLAFAPDVAATLITLVLTSVLGLLAIPFVIIGLGAACVVDMFKSCCPRQRGNDDSKRQDVI